MVSVKICMGTTCFVMGGNSLQELYDLVPVRYGNDVELTGIPCLGLCSSSGEYSKAPYVKVNDTVIKEATVDKVLTEIDKAIGED